jgi:hypothetical protein
MMVSIKWILALDDLEVGAPIVSSKSSERLTFSIELTTPLLLNIAVIPRAETT